jgi:hypothetical protein
MAGSLYTRIVGAAVMRLSIAKELNDISLYRDIIRMASEKGLTSENQDNTLSGRRSVSPVSVLKETSALSHTFNTYGIELSAAGIVMPVLRRFAGPRTSPSSGQATTFSLLRHRRLIACHSGAAFEGLGLRMGPLLEANT